MENESSSLTMMPQQPSITFRESSTPPTLSFELALQELRNLRPQLYSAAEYCEASYMYSEQKKVVVDNLKEYSVKALVNIVDHLGTVASKLNDFLGQQIFQLAASEIRVGSAAQRLHTCQEYSQLEGLKQQTLWKNYSRRHKHYLLPNFESEVKIEDSTGSVAKVVRKDSQHVEVIGDFLKGKIHHETNIISLLPIDISRQSTKPQLKAQWKAGDNILDFEAKQTTRLQEGRHSWQVEAGTLSCLLTAEVKALPKPKIQSSGYQLQSAAEALFSRDNTRAVSSSSKSGPLFAMVKQDQEIGSPTPIDQVNKILLKETRKLSSLISFEDVDAAQHYHSPSPQNRGILKSLLSRQPNAS